MPTTSEIKPKKLGIIAGGGDMPRLLIRACKDKGIEPFVVAFEGQTDPETTHDVSHLWARLGATGSVIKSLKSNDIEDLVLIGHMRRPTLKELKPDLKTAKFFAREGLNAMGDDGLLTALRRFLEKEGLRVRGLQEFVPDLLSPSGSIGRLNPSKEQQRDIARGVEVLRAMAPLDIGQAVVVQQGYVLGVEGAEGTDALVQRCSALQRKGQGAILVKLAKEGQDEDLDLPTIGPKTIENVILSGFSGIAVHAGHSFIHEIETVKMRADDAKVFVYGVTDGE